MVPLPINSTGPPLSDVVQNCKSRHGTNLWLVGHISFTTGNNFCSMEKSCCTTGKNLRIAGNIRCTTGHNFCTMGNNFCTMENNCCTTYGENCGSWGTSVVLQGATFVVWGTNLVLFTCPVWFRPCSSKTGGVYVQLSLVFRFSGRCF